MIGCISDSSDKIIHVATSSNYPWIPIEKKAFNLAYQKRREEYVGKQLWSYDKYVQDKICVSDANPTAQMPLQHRLTAQSLTGHRWSFEENRKCNTTSPTTTNLVVPRK
jgi:hypothetical protein